MQIQFPKIRDFLEHYTMDKVQKVSSRGFFTPSSEPLKI
jgi:hypothetical protein